MEYLFRDDESGFSFATRVSEGKKKQSKLDFIKELEKLSQKQWEKEKIFEVDDDDLKRPKYFAAITYPSIDGILTLQSSHSIIKADFAANFQRLQGKRVLLPFEFHYLRTKIKVKFIKSLTKRQQQTN